MWLWTGGDRECGVWVIAGRSNAFAGECSTAISPSGIAAALAHNQLTLFPCLFACRACRKNRAPLWATRKSAS